MYTPDYEPLFTPPVAHIGTIEGVTTQVQLYRTLDSFSGEMLLCLQNGDGGGGSAACYSDDDLVTGDGFMWMASIDTGTPGSAGRVAVAMLPRATSVVVVEPSDGRAFVQLPVGGAAAFEIARYGESSSVFVQALDEKGEVLISDTITTDSGKPSSESEIGAAADFESVEPASIVASGETWAVHSQLVSGDGEGPCLWITSDGMPSRNLGCTFHDYPETSFWPAFPVPSRYLIVGVAPVEATTASVSIDGAAAAMFNLEPVGNERPATILAAATTLEAHAVKVRLFDSAGLAMATDSWHDRPEVVIFTDRPVDVSEDATARERMLSGQG